MATALGSAVPPASLEVPLTQQTAPVLEFRCLYTSDIRKKVKKWQDGRLKYHTFNKKIMVWDEGSHLIGESYWRDDAEFGDGEELRLERNGTLVEVAECIGKHETDLTDLVGKRVKEREIRAAAKIANGTPTRHHTSFVGNQETPNAAINLQSKSLTAVLTPTGHYGRAMMAHTSPFEDRQQSGNVIQQDQENERPAKRRKQQSPPSKRGYAQNLMGTKITLTSSRLPSTATSRYEPLKVKAIQQTPTSTIDLTVDEDVDDATARKRVRREEMSNEERPPKMQRWSRCSPKAKSTYASNLTGTNLTLSRPDSCSQKYRSSPQVDQSYNVDSKSLLDSLSNSAEDYAFQLEELPFEHSAAAEDKGTKESRANQPRSRQGRRPRAQSCYLAETPLAGEGKRSRRENSPIVLSSSSEGLAVPLPRLTESVPKGSAPGSSELDPTPGRLTSALRIKSRPLPKMMMLMNRPNARSMRSTDPSIPRRSGSKPLDEDSQQPAPSQATMQLNAFSKKQEEALQARLSRKMPQERLGDLSSSTIDKGIDHQTIGLLLTRKNKPLQKGESYSTTSVAEEKFGDTLQSVDTSRGMVKSQEPVHKMTKEPEGNIEGVKEPAAPLIQDDPVSTFVDSEPSNGEKAKRSEPNMQPLVPALISMALESGHCQKPSQQAKDEIGKETCSKNKSLVVDGLHAVEIIEPAQILAEALPPKRSTPLEVFPTVNGSKNQDKKIDFISSSIQSATDHFRAIIKASASPQSDLNRVAPLPPSLSDECGDLSRRTFETLRLESALEESSFKQSPKSTVITTDELKEVECGSVDVQVKSFGAPDAEMLPLKNISVVVAKTKLVNPATRGKSLQSVAARTLDALNPVNMMAPPAPRISRRGEKPPVIIEGATIGEAAAVREETSGGPWSRESFDLFGNWQPPGGIVANGNALT